MLKEIYLWDFTKNGTPKVENILNTLLNEECAASSIEYMCDVIQEEHEDNLAWGREDNEEEHTAYRISVNIQPVVSFYPKEVDKIRNI